MTFGRLRITGIIGCAAFALLLTPRMNAAIAGPPFVAAQDQWERSPDGWNDVQRRGYHDGIEGARKDYQNHRTPDVDNRDEYRHPDVPSEMRAAYREAFRHGYNVGMSHLTGAPEWRMQAPERPWDAPPNEFDDIHRQGYRDGIEGARKDYDNHRRPDVNNRDEYRHPHVPGDEQNAYRDGFRRGYQSAWDHMGMSRY